MGFCRVGSLASSERVEKSAAEGLRQLRDWASCSGGVSRVQRITLAVENAVSGCFLPWRHEATDTNPCFPAQRWLDKNGDLRDDTPFQGTLPAIPLAKLDHISV